MTLVRTITNRFFKNQVGLPWRRSPQPVKRKSMTEKEKGTFEKLAQKVKVVLAKWICGQCGTGNLDEETHCAKCTCVRQQFTETKK